jgi:predicted PurR-regulated permease PerM
MENFAERYRGTAFLTLFLGTVILGVVIILPFLPALMWAVVLSILMHPLYRRLGRFFRRRGFSRGADSWASSLTTIITFLIICVPFVLIGIGLYAQVASLIKELNVSKDQGQGFIQQALAQVDLMVRPITARFGTGTLSLADYAKANGAEIVKTLQQPISHAFGRIIFTGLSLVIALLTMFFMLRDGERLREPAYELLPLPPDRTEMILKKIGETVYAVFIGTVLVAIIQAVLLGIGFEIARVPNAFLFSIMAVFLCTIPLVGAPLIYIPAALVLAASGHFVPAMIVVGFGLVVTKLDYFLRPLLIGNRTSLHPIGIFFGILGGVLVFGPVGLVAGPMVLAVLLALQDVVRERVRGVSGDSLPMQPEKVPANL